MKNCNIIARQSSVKQWTRSVSSFLLTFATYSALHASLGCNAQLGSTDNAGSSHPLAHGAVPGLFAADEVWAVSNAAAGSNEFLLIRGYGNTIEYIVAGRPGASSIDGDAVTPPLISVGLEPPSASVSFKDGTVRMNAEFADIHGRNCKLDLTATPCTPPDPGSAACALENLNVTMTVDGDVAVPPGASLNLVRLEPCLKSLELSDQGPGWAITSVPFLALTSALSSVANTKTGGSGTPSSPALLLVQGTNDLVRNAEDTSSLLTSPANATGCGAGEGFSSSPPQGSVAFDGPNLQIDLAMLQLDKPDAQDNVQIVTPEDGVCAVAFKGQVTYCALWKSAAGGEVGGASLKVIRVDGEGHRHLPDAGQSGLSHVYVILGLPDPGASGGSTEKSALKRVVPSEWP